MQSGKGQLVEIYYETGLAGGLIHCPDALVPAPGQYVLAVPPVEKAIPTVLPAAIFSAGPAENGFLAAPSLPEAWGPGMRLALRGPLGRGFTLPDDSRRLALIAWDDSPACLLALLPQALAQEAEVTLACSTAPAGLQEDIEIQPLAALEEVVRWADYLAIDLEREALPDLRKRFEKLHGIRAQVLVHTAMPCGALAECGACAVHIRHRWSLVCKDGPVFDLNELRE
jgi:NAD(P)H-flavin reductase